MRKRAPAVRPGLRGSLVGIALHFLVTVSRGHPLLWLVAMTVVLVAHDRNELPAAGVGLMVGLHEVGGGTAASHGKVVPGAAADGSGRRAAEGRRHVRGRRGHVGVGPRHGVAGHGRRHALRRGNGPREAGRRAEHGGRRGLRLRIRYCKSQ